MPTLTIELQVAADKLPLAKEYFLKEHPIPKDEDDNDQYTFIEWLTMYVRQRIVYEIIVGKQRIDAEAADLDNIIT